MKTITITTTIEAPDDAPVLSLLYRRDFEGHIRSIITDFLENKRMGRWVPQSWVRQADLDASENDEPGAHEWQEMHEFQPNYTLTITAEEH